MNNKFGVPHKEYFVNLADERKFNIDIGCEEDWGNVQRCLVGCNSECAGWGCEDEWSEITGVFDHASGKIYGTRDAILEWAESCVWKYVNDYSK